MGEVSVACPVCGQSLNALNQDDLVKAFKEHANHEHSMGLSDEQASEKVQMSLGAQSED